MGLSIHDLDMVRKATNKLIDVHMMVTNPGRHVQLYAEHGADIIYFHPEADARPDGTIAKIRELGIYQGLQLILELDYQQSRNFFI